MPAPDIYGWRKKIGLVIPSNNTVIEPELWTMRPPGVTVHASRILSRGSTPEAIRIMQADADRAIDELRAGELDVIAYACLATSLVMGHSWTEAVAEGIRTSTGCRATSAAAATLGALHALGVSRVAFATPYNDRINAFVGSYVEAGGITVTRLKNLVVARSLDLWKVPPAEVCDLARAVDSADAEAVCIVATDLPTAGVIEALEAELGKPVVTTNQAILWHSLQLAGVPDPVPGFGRLLAAPPAPRD